MSIAMTGATRYVGKRLSNYLTEKGGRRIIPLGGMMLRENMSGLLAQMLTHYDVIINLAGTPINQRWTPEHKQGLFNSRITVTRRIIRVLNAVKTKPKLMISASTIGYCPSLVESDEYTQTHGGSFLSDPYYMWEKGAKRCPQPTRLVITRFGIVLSPDGGVMQQMLRPLRAAEVTAVIGPGMQPSPWIDIRGLCHAISFFVGNEELRGAFSLVTPQAVSQSAFTRAMGKMYHARATLIVPQAVFRLLYGEAASLLTAGQSVCPTRLLETGFHFSVPTVEKLFEGADHSMVGRLNLKRYMGLWYGIARYDRRFERGPTEVTATYTLRSDGTIRVKSRGYKCNSPYGICKAAAGYAKISDPAQPGRLKVSFFLNFYFDYYVMELNQGNYNYALIGSSTDRYPWMLSRAPQLPEDIEKKLVATAERRSYDTSRLQWIGQS